MDLAWNDRRTRQFITNVGLITSNGPAGLDIMAQNGLITYLILQVLLQLM